jgi:hypothetical protein
MSVSGMCELTTKNDAAKRLQDPSLDQACAQGQSIDQIVGNAGIMAIELFSNPGLARARQQGTQFAAGCLGCAAVSCTASLKLRGSGRA